VGRECRGKKKIVKLEGTPEGIGGRRGCGEKELYGSARNSKLKYLNLGSYS